MTEFERGFAQGFEKGFEAGRKSKDATLPINPFPTYPYNPFSSAAGRCPKCQMNLDGVRGYVCSSPNCPTAAVSY